VLPACGSVLGSTTFPDLANNSLKDEKQLNFIVRHWGSEHKLPDAQRQGNKEGRHNEYQK
jgi:hypothetical protein